RAMERVEGLPLLVERGLGGGRILRILAGQPAAAERDDATRPARYREDQPPAEAVVVTRGVLPGDHEPRREQGLDQMTLAARGAEEVVPPLGRVAEAEGPRGLAVDPAVLEVGPRARRFRRVPEPGLEPARGPLHE